MEIIYKKVKDLKCYEKNARQHSDEQVDQIIASINEYGFTNPILIDEKNKIIAGHGRLLASKKMGLDEVPCIILKGLTEAQKKAYCIADNKMALNASWDLNTLAEELESLKDLDFDLSLTGFSDDELNEILGTGEDLYKDKPNELNLQERFIAPPFSVLNSQLNYWQERKKKYIEMGIDSGKGRKANLLGMSEQTLSKVKSLNGTSIFDPVLCEICYEWFGKEKGLIFDPFAGGSVRGVVAKLKGYDYLGIDLRPEQVEANRETAEKLNLNVHWECDDSLNQDKYINDNTADLVFSCPPYADLEKYSDDPRDLSNMNYEEFKKVYFDIIRKSCNKLKNNRFACFVVGEVRAKDGSYYNFVSDTIKAFEESGLKYYNEIILLNSFATAGLRAGKIFSSTRKIVKVHQNVLVFYKGDIDKITKEFPKLEECEDILKQYINEEAEEEIV